MDNQFRAVPDG